MKILSLCNAFPIEVTQWNKNEEAKIVTKNRAIAFLYQKATTIRSVNIIASTVSRDYTELLIL